MWNTVDEIAFLRLQFERLIGLKKGAPTTPPAEQDLVRVLKVADSMEILGEVVDEWALETHDYCPKPANILPLIQAANERTRPKYKENCSHCGGTGYISTTDALSRGVIIDDRYDHSRPCNCSHAPRKESKIRERAIRRSPLRRSSQTDVHLF